MLKDDMVSRSAFMTYMVALNQEYNKDDFDQGKAFERERLISVLKSFPSVDNITILKAAKEIENNNG